MEYLKFNLVLPSPTVHQTFHISSLFYNWRSLYTRPKINLNCHTILFATQSHFKSSTNFDFASLYKSVWSLYPTLGSDRQVFLTGKKLLGHFQYCRTRCGMINNTLTWFLKSSTTFYVCEEFKVVDCRPKRAKNKWGLRCDLSCHNVNKKNQLQFPDFPGTFINLIILPVVDKRVQKWLIATLDWPIILVDTTLDVWALVRMHISTFT